MQSLEKLFALLLLPLLLTACSSGSSRNDDDGEDGGGVVDPGATAFKGFDFDLAVNDFWTFAWSFESRSVVQGSNPSTDLATGRFTVTLVSQAPAGGMTIFEVEVEGETADPDGHSFAPRWKYLALEDDQLLGSLDGNDFEVLFDAAEGSWAGGGFFADFASAERVAENNRLSNEFTDTAAIGAGTLVKEGGCQYFASIGETICSGDEDVFLFEFEYFKAGIGPLGYSFNRNVTDDGGGFFTSFTTRREVGLIETSLVADDGFEPQLPPWDEVAPMPAPLAGLGAAGLGGRLYAFGRLDAASGGLEAGANGLVYEPAADAWSPIAPMPTVTGPCTAVAFANRIFVFGERLTGGETTFDVYDPVADAWESRLVPEGVSMSVGGAAALFGANIGLQGGGVVDDVIAFTSSGLTSTAPLEYLVLRPGEIDPSGDLWVLAGDDPFVRTFRHAVTSSFDELVIVGGIRSSILSPAGPSSTVVFVEIASAAGRGTSLQNAVADTAAVSVEGEVFVLGGLRSFSAQRSVESLAPGSTEWVERAPMPQPKKDHAAAVVDGQIYVLGGGGSVSVFRYDPKRDEV